MTSALSNGAENLNENQSTMVSSDELAKLSGTSVEDGKCSLFLQINGDHYLDGAHPMRVTTDTEKLHNLRGSFAIAFEQETAFESH